jgi:hypothetical protein
MNRIQQKRLWIAIIIFISFLICFFMNITGLAIHQWIGILCGVVVSYHLLAHRDWVKAVTLRFFRNTSSQARLFYLIDFALLIGFGVMIGTGLLISTWLNLSLASYASWRTVHILASITTLLAVVIKIGVHARWIICTASKMLQRPVVYGKRNTPLTGATTGVDRRAFLKLMGIVGAASVIAISSSAKSLWPASANSENQVSKETPVNREKIEPTDELVTAIDESQDSGELSSQTGENQAASSTPMPTDEPQVLENQTSAPAACTVRCSRGCSYPGHCRRYTDSNSNNRCDLGECLS